MVDIWVTMYYYTYSNKGTRVMARNNVWVISDTHFGHKNILSFKDKDTGDLIRGKTFSSVEEMDETLIDNWNRVVKPGDKIYHLGDVFFGNKIDFMQKWNRLNGKKRLILGNHDDATFFMKYNLVSRIAVWRLFPEYNLVLTHVPLHDTVLRENRFKGKVGTNIHGHIHHNPSPTENHRNVSVENINYTPINIEEFIL